MSRVPMIAAKATLRRVALGRTERLAQLGRMLNEWLESLGREAGFSARISGPPANPY